MSAAATGRPGQQSCGCCDGAGPETPAELWNRAGLPAIAYRIGTHGSFKATLLSRLSDAGFPGLHGLTSRADSDPAIALLDAAAAMADVLTFYQERIANESYLRTATERRSLVALGRLTGFEPSPGIAATAYLAFTLEDAAGAPEESPIPAGTRVQSIPAAGALPQTFETLADFTGRPEWNAMRAVTRQPHPVPDSGTAVILARGIATGVRPGDRLVLTGPGGHWVRTVTAAEPDAAAGTTRIALQVPKPAPWPPPFKPIALPMAAFNLAQRPLTGAALDQDVITRRWDHGDLLAYVRSKSWPAAAVMAGVMHAATRPAPPPAGLDGTPGAFRFRQRAAVFGHNAPAWNTLPEAQRQGPGGPATALLTAGQRVPNAPGLVVGASVSNVTLVNATIAGAPLPPGPGGAAGLPLVGGVVQGGVVVPGAPPGTPHPVDWDSVGRTLDYLWDGNALVRDGDGAPRRDNTRVPLDHAYSGIGPGSLALLEEGGTATVFGVAAVGDRSAVAFSLSARVTELNLGEGVALGGFGRRGTAVHCDSEPLALADAPVEEPVAGGTVLLDRIYLGLRAGQYVALVGQRADLPGVMAAEIAALAAVAVSGNSTALTLARPLAHSYERASLRVNANVVVATHGAAVAETLGSGDAARLFQAFTLGQPALTHVTDPVEGGSRSTLTVRVNGEAWREVPSLYGAGPEDRVFTTWLEEDGRTRVAFGDGVTGARLPTGAGNVGAAYRAGIGSPGLVGAGAVSLLMTRPLGVRSVTNPIPTADAADPDAPAMLRQTVPLHVLTLDRVVSLEDYRNFALAYPGVFKAHATWRAGARRRGVLLTVAGAGGLPPDPTGPFARGLLAALRGASDPRVAVALGGAIPVFFQVAASLRTDPALIRGAVEAAVGAALAEAFALPRRDFGQPVRHSEVVAVIQDVPGVLACDLEALYRLDGAMAPGVHPVLEAHVPAPGGGTSRPAEILLLDPRPIAFGVLP
ncbi:baseplate J/gp47 family protein [Roseomonas populi]|uniref:Baseplate assembly protein n=1 Tax=Roseomonas populi TaxID=3121582 RepID=A0ABT1X3T2_9PROT|nr:hypothetical protein [Roseomonas pecuniae]MCR0982761.1 hypothetical protein [Roseomonas pecuniae]